MSKNYSTKSHERCVEILDAALQFQSSFEKSHRSILPTDAKLTCTADVNEQLRMKLVRHSYSLLVFVGREGRLWDDCQRSKVKLFSKSGLLSYLINCPDIRYFVFPKTNASCFNTYVYQVYVVLQWEHKQW
jgi:hypothetical protein